jgi:Plasmid pRiA4b ORF-3-like protein
MTQVASIVRLKVTLDDVEPKVLRRLEVPLDLRLDRLHLVLQAVLGWTNSHLWEFRAGDVGWGLPDPEWDARSGPLDARKTTLLRVIEDTGTRTLTYLYDFGDGWEHTIRIERIADAHPGLIYPVLLEAVGRCPPEDVGGPPGYEEFLAALSDPEHEAHAEMLEWCPGGFDPHAVDPLQIEQALQKTARRWTRKPNVKRP